jgi:hypothetical protein
MVSQYGAFQRLEGIPGPPGEPKPHVNKNACTVQFSPSLSLQFSIGIPFFGTHELGDRSNSEGEILPMTLFSLSSIAELMGAEEWYPN